MSQNVINFKISHLFDKDEKRSIVVFQERGQELLNTKIMRESGNIHLHATFIPSNPLNTQVELPSEEDLRSFYMAFRFFYLQKEPSHFPRVLNIIGRHSPSDTLSKYLASLRDQWDGALTRQLWQVSIDGQELTTSLLIDLWFNAYYFHTDDAKARRLQQLNEILSSDFNRFLLVNAVFDAAKAVCRLYESVKTIII
jgi:hypothetical protein